MVIIESLAAGTPVVGTKSGAIPEVLDSPDVGIMIEPDNDPRELSRALIQALNMAQDPIISKKCRQYVAPYSWDKLGPLYESLYLDVLGQQ
jgi:glycosyltransferase involved in cell wall biosynthesis